jgi:hypothetical protein
VRARCLWQEHFQGRFNITFIDNNSARFGLVRGYSPVLDSARLIGESWLCDARLGAASWYARVPTAANIADGPSRLDFAALRRIPGSRYCPIALPVSWGDGDVWNVLASRLARDFS